MLIFKARKHKRIYGEISHWSFSNVPSNTNITLLCICFFFIIIITTTQNKTYKRPCVFVYLHITITYILMRCNAFYFQFAKHPQHVDKMGIFVVEGESMWDIVSSIKYFLVMKSDVYSMPIHFWDKLIFIRRKSRITISF